MSKTGQQSQGGSGKPNFTSYKKGTSSKGSNRRKAERKGKAFGKKLRKERRADEAKRGRII